MSFSSLGLPTSLINALDARGISVPTPIQEKAIPSVLERRDILGIAKTGSGKTASYVLPILHNLQRLSKDDSSGYREPAVLVLVPTRELALQVHGVIVDYLPVLEDKYRCLAIHGGVSINPQMQAVGNADIIVCTPGRLIDLVTKNAVKLSSVSTLVLDEADKMLNLGFKEEVDHILSLLPSNRQNLLFSATLSDDLNSIQQLILNDPMVIKISDEKILAESSGTGSDDGGEDAVELINQIGYFVPDEKKGPLLRYLIKHKNLQQVLVFASSTRMVDNVTNKLWKNKIDSAAVHSKMSQMARRENLNDFKSGKLRVLVATDLLARGIDISFLPCVINYQLPRSPKDYTHRIGRTGRAGSPGDAISLVSPDEMHHFRVIQKKMGKRVKMIHSEDIDLHGY
ncbi:MAG: DEAD/DEAH box helicase [Akkermansiaceae bacterium]